MVTNSTVITAIVLLLLGAKVRSGPLSPAVGPEASRQQADDLLSQPPTASTSTPRTEHQPFDLALPPRPVALAPRARARLASCPRLAVLASAWSLL